MFNNALWPMHKNNKNLEQHKTMNYPFNIQSSVWISAELLGEASGRNVDSAEKSALR